VSLRARFYRRWAFESAALDLALRQNGLAARRRRASGEARHFVVSIRIGDPASLSPCEHYAASIPRWPTTPSSCSTATETGSRGTCRSTRLTTSRHRHGHPAFSTSSPPASAASAGCSRSTTTAGRTASVRTAGACSSRVRDVGSCSTGFVFHPDGPNDLAPVKYNLQHLEGDLPRSPLPPEPDQLDPDRLGVRGAAGRSEGDRALEGPLALAAQLPLRFAAAGFRCGLYARLSPKPSAEREGNPDRPRLGRDFPGYLTALIRSAGNFVGSGVIAANAP
jgi:hypothetical protein